MTDIKKVFDGENKQLEHVGEVEIGSKGDFSVFLKESRYPQRGEKIIIRSDGVDYTCEVYEAKPTEQSGVVHLTGKGSFKITSNNTPGSKNS